MCSRRHVMPKAKLKTLREFQVWMGNLSNLRSFVVKIASHTRDYRYWRFHTSDVAKWLTSNRCFDSFLSTENQQNTSTNWSNLPDAVNGEYLSPCKTVRTSNLEADKVASLTIFRELLTSEEWKSALFQNLWIKKQKIKQLCSDGWNFGIEKVWLENLNI